MTRRSFFGMLTAAIGALAFWRPKPQLPVETSGYLGLSRKATNELWTKPRISTIDIEESLRRQAAIIQWQSANEPDVELMSLERYNAKLKRLRDAS